MDIKPTPAKEIAGIINAKVVGDGKQSVSGFNEIHRVRKGDCCFVDHPKYYAKALSSAATTVIIDKEVNAPEGKVLLVHAEPFTAFNLLTRHFNPLFLSRINIAASAKVAGSAVIMPGCFVGE